jgi:glycosyltransferase involved in cell wall biosynthesis
MISILMPTYNGIEFINDSVTSVLTQTYENWELLIGVNGHPENSEVFQTAKLYETIDNRIKVYDFYNIKGKSNTLNELIHCCKYDFIGLLDVDDIWNYKKLEIQSGFLNSYDIVGSRCIYFGDLNGIVPKIPINDLSNFNFAEVNPIINSSSIIKKELCYWNDNWDGIEDYDLWIRLRLKNKRFYNCPEILVQHRIHTSSAFNSGGKNNINVPNLLKHHNMA